MLNKYLLQLVISLVLLCSSVTCLALSRAEQCDLNGVDYQQAVNFVKDLQTAIRGSNFVDIVKLASYPVVVNTGPNKSIIIDNQKQLLNNLQRYFPTKIQSKILQTSATEVFCNYQGAMIANGAIWFRTKDNPGYFTINLR